jgi:ATP phosphoribosyltransferase
MSGRLIVAVPSKGRLMDQAAELFAKAGLELRKVGSQRGYRGEIAGFDDVEVVFVSASEITALLKAGRAHLGVTGEDLVRETMADADARVSLLVPLGFGRADVVVAVPAAWIDVRRMADLEAAAMLFQRTHGRRLRVATKYMNLTRRFFAAKGVTGYRIVESLGATEGTPAAGAAELIVDITTTGTTLKANGLKVLDDGVILKSQAHLVASKLAPWTRQAEAMREKINARLASASGLRQ